MVDTKIIKIVTHYERSDPEFLYDYAEIEVFVDSDLVAEYGDYYHDKGSEKVEGFIDGFKTGVDYKTDVVIVRENVADKVW